MKELTLNKSAVSSRIKKNSSENAIDNENAKIKNKIGKRVIRIASRLDGSSLEETHVTFKVALNCLYAHNELFY